MNSETDQHPSSPKPNDVPTEHVNGPLIDDNDPTVPPQSVSPVNLREEIVNDILDLTDQLASVALFGLIGVQYQYKRRGGSNV